MPLHNAKTAYLGYFASKTCMDNMRSSSESSIVRMRLQGNIRRPWHGTISGNASG